MSATPDALFVTVSLVIVALGAAAALAWLALIRPRLGLYAIFALTPTQFIFVPVSTFHLSPADVLVAAAASGLVVRLLLGDPRTREAIRLHVWLGLMIAAYLIGFLILDYYSRTLIRVPLGMVPSILACELLRTRRQIARAVTALVAAGILDAAYGGLYIAAGQPLHPTRFSGMMGVNFSAMVILTAAALAFARFARTRDPVKLLVPGALTAFGLATLSKMGAIALAIAWILVVSRVLTRANKRLIWAVAIVLAALALPQEALWQRVLARGQPELQIDGVMRTSTDVRMLILETAWRGFTDQPIVGVGYYNFERYSTTDPDIRRSTAGIGYGTHNTYLEILVEGGLLAFIPLMLHFASYRRGLKSAWRLVTRDADAVVAAPLAGLVVVLISAGVANVLLHYLFWSICGVALATVQWARSHVEDAGRDAQAAIAS